MKEIESKIVNILDKIRPYLNNDGGDVEFIKFDKGIVYVSLKGACAGCDFAQITLQDTVEEMLVSEIPEVIKVVNVEEEALD